MWTDANGRTGERAPHGMLGRETDAQIPENLIGQDLLYGLVNFIPFPAGNVSEIDINFVAHKDSTSLETKVSTMVDYNEELLVSVPAPGQVVKKIGDGSFRIYPIEGTTFLLKSFDSNFSPEITSLLNLCRKAIQQGKIDSTRIDANAILACNTLGITCVNSSDCNFPGTLAINSSISDTLTTRTNPFIEFAITGAKASNSALTNSSIAVWVEGGYIKARFLGDNYAGYDDGNIELVLVDKSITGNTYGKITAVDYVRRRAS
jgi:hypothetical protein